MKHSYDNIFKSLNKEIVEYIRRKKDHLCSWIVRINIVKLTILSKEIYRFSTIPFRISINYLFIDLDRVWFSSKPYMLCLEEFGVKQKSAYWYTTIFIYFKRL